MKIKKITKKDLDGDNFYKKSELDFDGNIEIEKNLGYVKFKRGVCAKGYILAEAGSGIKAGEGIEAGWGIEAGEGIEAGLGIKACLGIKAGSGIEAGEGIKAGSGIKAGEGIEAGWGIEAGLSIICNGLIKFSYQLFAGICTWRKLETKDLIIECEGIETNGEIKHGELKLIKKEENKVDNLKNIITIDGKKYELKEVIQDE